MGDTFEIAGQTAEERMEGGKPVLYMRIEIKAKRSGVTFPLWWPWADYDADEIAKTAAENAAAIDAVHEL